MTIDLKKISGTSNKMQNHETKENSIIRLTLSGWSCSQIEVLEISSRTISKTLKFYNKFLLIPSPPKKGRPLKLNSEVMEIVEMETLHSPRQSLAILSNKIGSEHEIDLGEATFFRTRHLLRLAELIKLLF
jgi:transposase